MSCELNCLNCVYNDKMRLSPYWFLFESDYDYLYGLNDDEDIADYGYILHRIDKTITGLPTEISLYTTFVGSKRWCPKELPYVPVILVQGKKDTVYNIDMIPVTISSTPEILNPPQLIVKKSTLTENEWDEIFDFIKRNYEVLITDWNTGEDGLKKKYSCDNIDKLLK